MARKVDPFAPYRMSTHKLGKYVYVCTQPATVDEASGKRTYSRIHWGRFDPQKKTFTPALIRKRRPSPPTLPSCCSRRRSERSTYSRRTGT